MLGTSIATGIGEGIAQPAAGKYISDCTTEETKGFYYAFFWSFYMGSQVFGNLIAAFILGNFDQRYFVMVITFIGVCSTTLIFFMKSPRLQLAISRTLSLNRLGAGHQQVTASMPMSVGSKGPQSVKSAGSK